MVKRLLDVVVATIAMIALWPVFIIAAIGIILTSPGPVIHCAERTGIGGRTFTMYKFRTMHVRQELLKSAITAWDDPRIFPFGKWLRLLKIDELPQLLNVIKGDMSIIGPRPEDPEIVAKYYTTQQRATLSVRPGLASPGSIYNYTHGEQILDTDDPEETYIESLLPVKLALDSVYIQEASLIYDLGIAIRTLAVIFGIAFGYQNFSDPPEMALARNLLCSERE